MNGDCIATMGVLIGVYIGPMHVESPQIRGPFGA